jgi:RNA polymerase sigma-70 factor (ECF subfamily)
MLRLLRIGTKGEPQRRARVDPLLALANSAALGDKRAQRTLLVELGPSLLRTVRAILGTKNLDAEDALQESMAALVLALPSFRGECTIRHYACQIAVQIALNVRRRARLRAKYAVVDPDEELNDIVTLEPSPAEQAEAVQRIESLRDLLCELPEIHSDVLAMHVVLGFTVEETALTLGVPVNTVRSRLRRALATLRESIQRRARVLEELGRKG